MRYIAARYVDESMIVIIKLNNDSVVRGRVLQVTKERGAPKKEGRVHIKIASGAYPAERAHPYTLHPDQSVGVCAVQS